MNKEKNRSSLLKLLDDRLKTYNFLLNKNLAEFTKKENEGWNKFQLIFLNRDTGWEINIGMLIRKNIVEDIYHRASSFEPKYHKTTPTIGTTVENFINDNRKYRCYLNSEKDIKICFEYLDELFIKIALPFFKEYSTLDKMDEAVNIKSGTSIFSGLKYEGNLGIILAKLVRNPNYAFFLDKYHRFYTNLNDGYYLPEYEKLVKILEDYNDQ